MREMNLRLTLMDSAQAFHWRKIGGVFAAVVDGRVLTSADEDAFARAYFDDARDYSRLMEDCAAYPVAARAVQATPGLRVLNQPSVHPLGEQQCGADSRAGHGAQ
ncbi:MAG: hypothetical protein Q4B19_09000 [Clostridia bacterium]|nr:hypothetical protein [Clostridia bacterium]